MKLNKKGWGFKMMLFLMGLLIFALLIAVYFIYEFYNEMNLASRIIVKVVDILWRKTWLFG